MMEMGTEAATKRGMAPTEVATRARVSTKQTLHCKAYKVQQQA